MNRNFETDERRRHGSEIKTRSITRRNRSGLRGKVAGWVGWETFCQTIFWLLAFQYGQRRPISFTESQFVQAVQNLKAEFSTWHEFHRVAKAAAVRQSCFARCVAVGSSLDIVAAEPAERHRNPFSRFPICLVETLTTRGRRSRIMQALIVSLPHAKGKKNGIV